MKESILVADDHSVVRIGLSITLKKLRPQAKIEEASSFRDVLDLIKKERFDLIILDINMPDGTFQQSFEIIKRKQPAAKVLVFSSQDEDVYAIRYLRLGADGYLHKMAAEETINQALERMFSKGKYLSDNVQLALIDQSLNRKSVVQNPLTALSGRELEIAILLIKGMTLKEIANQLSLHLSTISTYKGRIFEKLEVGSLPELIDVFRFYENLTK